jgi:energy-coupling factor transport system substrate-specific component
MMWTRLSGRLFDWENIDLITVGTFAALIRVSTYLITICGGGMNPFAFILKNIMITGLLVVLCHKVPRPGVLTLYMLVNYLFSLALTGSVPISVPTLVICALLADLIICYGARIHRNSAILAGVLFYKLSSVSVGFAWQFLVVREDPRLMLMPLAIVMIGSIGYVLGLPVGMKLLKELRHAGIVRN